MIIEKNKLEFFNTLLKNARAMRQDEIEKMEEAYRQYRGSTKINGGADALTVRNITYELIESQVSTEIPIAKVRAGKRDALCEGNARRTQLLCEKLRDELPFEKMNDADERYTYIYGGSVWFLEWDETLSRSGAKGGIKITNTGPLDFIGQPGIYEIQDMEYCFLIFDTTKSEITNKYCVPYTQIVYGCDEADGLNDAVTVYMCYYRNEKGKVCRFIWSGDTVLSDIEDYQSRKIYICESCGQSRELCFCEEPRLTMLSDEFETLCRDTVRSDGSVLKKGTRIKWYEPKHFPFVIRKNIFQEKSLWGQSDCAYIQPQQIEINKILSRIHEKLIMSGIYPYKPDDCRFQMDNSIGGKVLNMRPGENAAQFGVIDTTPEIERDMKYIESTYNDAKKVLGITEAYQGSDDRYSQSGKAKQILVSQSAGRLESKRVMKNAAYADIDRIIFEMYLAYADEPRSLFYRDETGKIHTETFSRYDFVEYDAERGEFYYNDDYLFSAEKNFISSSQYEYVWQQNLENFKAGVFGNPEEALTQLRYWQAQERVRYPYARENAEYFMKQL